ncbi:MAG: YmfQ family protein [Clostridiales bacterium]|nr:YmfQ family protein [Clostridiales bacterium]
MLSTVFNNQQRNGYEELLSYGPRFYKDFLEMDTNYRFGGYTLDVAAEGLETLMINQFIDSADEETIERLEKWLGITTDTSMTLEERRARVLVYWNGTDKLSGSSIKRLAQTYSGSSTEPTVVMTTHLTITVPVDEDSSVDLTDFLALIGKMIPAHIAYYIIQSTEMEVDSSTLEEFILQNINIRTAIPFWRCQLIDGSILLDGSQLLNAARSYNARVGLLYDYGDVETEQAANLAAVAILMAVETAETAETGGEIKVAASIDFWQSVYLDGTHLLDGSETLEYERQYNTAAVAITADIETSEDLAASLTTTRNLHYCDGSVILDGSTLLNSFIEKEEI